MIGGAILVAIAEGYAFAAKAGIDLQTTFEATRGGFAGGPAAGLRGWRILFQAEREPVVLIPVPSLLKKKYNHNLYCFR